MFSLRFDTPFTIDARVFVIVGCMLASLSLGCGTTREHQATQQLLMSDAVDRSVAHIDFSPLAGETVYLESRFMQQVKGTGFVNANYIISSLRQQLAASGALLQEGPEDADYIVEARVGTLGADGHDVQFGIPASSALNAAATIVASAPVIPVLPEVSFGRKTEDIAAAKIAVFAYHRETRQPAWKSGISVAQSNSRALWVLGAGPLESGSIHEGPKFAGGQLASSPFNKLGRNAPPDSAKALEEEILAEREKDFRSANVYDTRLQRNAVRRAGSPLASDRRSNLAPNAYVIEQPATPLPKPGTTDSKVVPAAANLPESGNTARSAKPAPAAE